MEELSGAATPAAIAQLAVTSAADLLGADSAGVYSRTGATLTIAMADPTNVFAMDDITFITGYRVEPVVASLGSPKERSKLSSQAMATHF